MQSPRQRPPQQRPPRQRPPQQRSPRLLDLPQDILITDILARLPLKDRLRFGASSHGTLLVHGPVTPMREEYFRKIRDQAYSYEFDWIMVMSWLTVMFDWERLVNLQFLPGAQANHGIVNALIHFAEIQGIDLPTKVSGDILTFTHTSGELTGVLEYVFASGGEEIFEMRSFTIVTDSIVFSHDPNGPGENWKFTTRLVSEESFEKALVFVAGLSMFPPIEIVSEDEFSGVLEALRV